jgi:hypothetical protein
MTETEWLKCGDPRTMLRFLSPRLSERVVRFFAMLACRAGPTLAAHEALEIALETTEKMIEGEASPGEVAEAASAIEWGRYEMCESLNNLAVAVDVAYKPGSALLEAAELAVASLSAVYPLIEIGGQEDEGYAAQCHLLRELIPFRPIARDPSWLTSDVLLLARGIYDEKAFDRMPILADALQDAGCENVDVLSHCRDSGEHVRGCWVVDLLLGKK